ncbi:unnamed protein product [Bursaphelenchus xylophilus]|uniref:(pine wood nematode) hypothetical protein n=1 Tax=Bursaphelenchus xylophilus TaxID=6326 RepID=A0A1I7S0Z2_BURXY|nr:unnamed protein product [Bursaphelenchus xylophilus]CAG9087911.1 unnamed protein product [Bursaphelenchus xylophilus]
MRLSIFLLLSAMVASPETMVFHLDEDCFVRTGDDQEISRNPGPCANVSPVLIDNFVMLFLRVKNSSAIEYATLEIRKWDEGEEFKLKFNDTSLKHVLNDDCVFSSSSFNAFLDMHVLYMAAECEETFGFTRTVLYTTKTIYTPPGGILHTDIPIQNRVFGIGMGNNIRRKSFISTLDTPIYVAKSGQIEAARKLHRIDEEMKVALDGGDKLYALFATNEFVTFAKRSKEETAYFQFSITVTDDFSNPRRSQDCNSTAGHERSLYFCFLDPPNSTHTDSSLNYDWIAPKLVNDDWFNRTGPKSPMSALVQECEAINARKSEVIRVLFPVLVFELTTISITLLLFSICVCVRKRKTYQQYKKSG